MGTKATTEQDEELYQELCAVMLKFEKAGLPHMRTLAIVGKIAGRLIACQDPFKVTPTMAMECLATNVELGNQEMCKELLKNKQS